MNPIEVIRRKRDGGELSRAEIQALVRGATDGSIPDYQISAWLMASFLRGLDASELDALTDAMLRSGVVLDLRSIPGPTADKHSTGGVGDKVSLCLAPLVAACGVYVPMISGRGLGHTGGTLDKLEAIPGYQTRLGVDRFLSIVREIGWSIMGQTADLCPADRRLYSLRDVTGTVESIPLIAASIMSKKLAEGAASLVLDVKMGTGAFMKKENESRELAQVLCGIGRRAGRKVSAFLTDMDQPLGRAAGNALETKEAVEVLKGDAPADLVELTVALGAEMLRLSGVDDGERKLRAAISSGSAYERYCQGVRLHGGNPDAPLPEAKERHEVRASEAGFIERIDTEALGLVCVALGAGRTRVDDVIDPAVGIIFERKLGDAVAKGDVLAVVHGSVVGVEGVRSAFRIGDKPVMKALIRETMLHST